MNNVTLIGRVGQDPDLRYTTSGTAVSEFNIAVDSIKDDEPNWITIVAWGATAQAVAEHVGKGRQIAIEGELRSHLWEAADGTKHSRLKVHARRIDFLAKPSEKTDTTAAA